MRKWVSVSSARSGIIVGDGMYDLLHIEDDVVGFSIGCLSRRYHRGIADSSVPSANVADRCVIFGGVTIMPNACPGSEGATSVTR